MASEAWPSTRQCNYRPQVYKGIMRTSRNLRSSVSVASLFVLALAFLSAPAHALPFDSTAVEIVEFSDYQCPFCVRAETTMAELRRAYGGSLRVIVKHQPLPFHQNARGAAEAAEAARNQGRFDEMHDRLFANQMALNPSDLEAYALAIGLDMERFRRDVASPEVKDRVERDRNIANAVGATGTPSFFVNGRSLRGAQPIEEFKRLIDEEIAEATRANRRGESWLSDRLSANNPALWGYLRGGQVPPKVAPVTTPQDRTIYQVSVNPKVDAIDGPPDALITMVVFTDYQCPFCKKLEPTLDELMTRYMGKIRRVMKHSPLPLHKDAEPAARAVICAQAQGKFWQMHDSLFDNQLELDEVALKKRAATLGLDKAKFARCLNAPATAARVVADMKLAGMVTARGTPNTFINGRKLTGSKPIEEFVAAIDEEIKTAQAQMNSGTAGKDLYDALIEDGKVFSPLDEEVFTFTDKPTTPILGNPKAKIRITLFSDFQCPFCSRVHAPLEEVVAFYKGKVAVAWKNFPLSVHQDAMPAAKAAMCAGEQKKFWEAEKLMFDNQTDLAEIVPNLPERIGLDVAKYGSCMNRGEVAGLIEDDMAEARVAGLRGTPTVYIQGRKFNSNSGYNSEAFRSVIDALLAGKEP